MLTRITTNTDTFHTVIFFPCFFSLSNFQVSKFQCLVKKNMKAQKRCQDIETKSRARGQEGKTRLFKEKQLRTSLHTGFRNLFHLILRGIYRNELFFHALTCVLQMPKCLLKQFWSRKMLFQFFVSIEQDSSPLIIVRPILKIFKHITHVRYYKKSLKIISIERTTVGAKYYLLIFALFS